MVCKNCGADLKPGIKYCLECGSYIDEEEDIDVEEENEELSTDFKPVEFRDELPKPKKKRRRLNLTTTDYLIYAGLLIVLIGSIIVIIVAVVKNNNANKQLQDPSTMVSQQAKTFTIDNYTVKVPAGVNPTVDGSTLSVSDNRNYSFSYTLQQQSFNNYVNDHSIIENELKAANHQINSFSEKDVNNKKFLIYDITVNGEREYFYLTKVNDKYTAVGVITILTNGNWELALSKIDEINSTVTFQS